jgi:C4-dicarboxylate transporter, DctM subunit
VGRVSMREMRRHGYPIRMAAAVVAAAGTIAILIPPSIVMVVFGILTGESIGQLLLAGIVPGIITALVFMTYCYLRLRKVSLVPAAVPAGGGATPPADDAEARPVPATGRAARIQAVAYCAVVFVVIIGGIYSGVFTANEAGAVGAFVAAVLAVVWTLSRRADPWSMLWTSLRETTVTTGMIFAILLGGGILSAFLVSAGVPSDLTRWVAQLDVPPLLVVVIILLLMLPLGMLLDGLSMLLITVPLTYPVVTDLGFNGVWFAVLVVIMIEIGLITPPVGINVFVVAGLHEEATVDDTFRGVLPFVLLDLGLIALFVAVPQIITTLPALVR